jgi:hypothetical protein
MSLSGSFSPVLVSYLDDFPVIGSPIFNSPIHSSMPSLTSPSPVESFMVDPLQLRATSSATDHGWPFCLGEASPWYSSNVEALAKLPLAVCNRFLDSAASGFSPINQQNRLRCQNCAVAGIVCLLNQWGWKCPPCACSCETSCCYTNRALFLEALRGYRDSEFYSLRTWSLYSLTRRLNFVF